MTLPDATDFNVVERDNPCDDLQLYRSYQTMCDTHTIVLVSQAII